jgi:hypothetical protein
LSLILLDSKGIDIILGMDWLSKYDRVIQCAKKVVRLTKKDGTTVEFVAAVQADQASMLTLMKEGDRLRRNSSSSRIL